MRIIRIDHGNALARQPFKNFALGARDSFLAAQIFNVRAARVVNQRHIRTRQLRQPADFTTVIHAELNHCITMRCVEFQQHQWHTDFVIQIAACGEHRIAHVLTQNSGQHFLHGRFAAATSERHQRHAEAAAPRIRQLRECAARIVYGDERHIGWCKGCACHIGYCRYGASGPRRCNMLMRVKMFAAQGDKQFTGFDVAAIRADRCERRVIAAMINTKGKRGFGYAHHARYLVSAAATAAASL